MSREQYYQIMSVIDYFYLFLAFVTMIGVIAWHKGFRFKIPRLNMAWILVGATLIRLPYLGESLWYDETFTSAMARSPFSELGHAILKDVHPPMAYLPFWAMAQIFGTSDMVLRIPSLLMSLVSIWLAYHIAIWIPQWWKHGDTDTQRLHGLMGAGAVALLPTHLIYGTEARAYIILTVIVMVGILAVARDRPSWFLFTALLPFVHAHGYIYLGALIFFSIYKGFIQHNYIFISDGHYAMSNTKWVWLITCGIVLVPSLIYMPVVFLQATDVTDGFWLRDVGLGGVLASVPNVIIGSRFFSSIGLILVPATFFVVAKTILHYRPNKYAHFLIAFTITIPLITAMIAWLFGLNIFLTRAFIPLGVLWAILIALYRPKWYFALVAIPLIYGVIPDWQRMNIRDYLSHCEGSDIVYAVSTSSSIMAWHYLDNVFVSEQSDDMNQSYPVELFGIPRIQWDDVSGDVCVVYLNNPMSNDDHRQFIQNLAPYKTWEYDFANHSEFIVYRVTR